MNSADGPNAPMTPAAPERPPTPGGLLESQFEQARAILARLDADLASHSLGVRAYTIDVLSALRGPDEAANACRKGNTTTWVRNAALPQTCEKGTDRWDVNQFGSGPRLPREDSHWADHVAGALRVLGIEWSYEEPPV